MESKTFSHHHNHHWIHVKWYMLCKACHVIHVMWYMLCDACFVIHVMTPTIDMPSVRRWCEGWERHIIHAGRRMRPRHRVSERHHHHCHQYRTYVYLQKVGCVMMIMIKWKKFFRQECLYLWNLWKGHKGESDITKGSCSCQLGPRLWPIYLASLPYMSGHVKWVLLWKTWKRLSIEQNPLEWGVNTCVSASWISYA